MTRILVITGLIILAASLPGVPTGTASDADLHPSKPPAFQLVVNGDFLSHGLAQYFQSVFPIDEQAEEGSVSRIIQVGAWGYLVPFPSDDHIDLHVVLRGGARASSIRSRGRVHTHTRESSNFWIVQEVLLDGEAVSLGGLGVSAPVHSELVGITTEYCEAANDLAQGFGEARFDLNRSRDDRKLTAAVEQQLCQEVYRKGSRWLQDINKWYRQEFLAEFRRSGLGLQNLRFSSDAKEVRVSAGLEGQALTEPPALSGWPIGLQLHQAIFNQLAAKHLASKTFTGEQLEQSSAEMNRFLNLPAPRKTEASPWSVTMDRHDPLALRLDGNTIEMTLRGESYTIGDNSFSGMNVIARYRTVRKDGELRLARDEQLEVLPPDWKPGSSLSARQQMLQTQLRRRFGGLFPVEIPFRDLTLPEELPSRGFLRIQAIQTEGGWLSVGIGYKRGIAK